MSCLFIIPSIIRNQYDIRLLRRCLESIKRFEPYQLQHTLIIDDASSKELCEPIYKELCEMYGCQVHFKEFQHSYSSQVNLGSKMALQHGYDYFVTVNNDIELCQPVINTLVKSFELNPRIAVIGPLLLYPSGRVQSAGFEIGLDGQPVEYNKHQYYMPDPHIEYNQPRCVEGVTGAFQMIRTGLFYKLMGYNEKYLMGFEDVDFCLKAWRMGAWVMYQPHAIVVHCESVTRGYVPCPRQVKSLEVYTEDVAKQPMGDIKLRVKEANRILLGGDK